MSQISPAFAEPSSGDKIWTVLAGKALLIGTGLRKTGYIIAGLGLIFFSALAIFNKISWKNLAYIMLSCFVLTCMIALINYFSTSGDPAANYDSFTGNGADSSVSNSTEVQGGVPQAPGG